MLIFRGKDEDGYLPGERVSDGQLLAVLLEDDGAPGEPLNAPDALALMDTEPYELGADLTFRDRLDPHPLVFFYGM